MSDKLQELCRHSAYHCLTCDNKAMAKVIEEYKKENAILIEQLEQAQSANQKLVEALEPFLGTILLGASFATGDLSIHNAQRKARQTLSEVKGNG